MKLLKVIKHSDLFPGIQSGNSDTQKIRQASRAVVFDVENNIALLAVTKHNYHKLPGGGVEEGEDFLEALKREALEEIGCEIAVNDELGKIIEYRDEYNLRQESFCYLAKLKGEKGKPDFTDEEIEDGFEILWTSLDDAIEILSKDEPNDYEGKFIKIRDLCFLEEAKKYENNNLQRP